MCITVIFVVCFVKKPIYVHQQWCTYSSNQESTTISVLNDVTTSVSVHPSIDISILIAELLFPLLGIFLQS